MTSPDPAYVRMYRNTVDRHREQATKELRYIIDRCSALLRRLEGGRCDLRDDAALITHYTAGLAQRLAALDALTEVEFLTTDPDAKESAS